jgi:endonuclease YncB( thermonuclease family)
MKGFQLLKNAVVADSETTGLNRGSGIGEIAIYDLDTRTVYEYLPDPRLAITKQASPFGDVTKLAGSAGDITESVDYKTWRDLIVGQIAMENGKPEMSWDDTLDQLKWQNPFLYRMVKDGKYPWLDQRAETPQELKKRRDLFRQFGVLREELGKQAAMEDVLSPGSELVRRLRGKTIWIANASFESKQIGAQIAALADVNSDRNFKEALNLETRSVGNADPLYVTGVEVNRARVFAQQTQDWTQVWKAYLANPPAAGETAVRDIQDVIKAFMSYGEKLGMHGQKDVYFGTGMDLSFRLFGSLEKDPNLAKHLLTFAEFHRAGEDAAITENYVLRKAIKYTSALQEVHEQTDAGQRLIQMAKEGRGELYEAGQFFKRLEGVAPVVVRGHAIKRLQRAYQSIQEMGYSAEVSGIERIRYMEQATPSMKTEKIANIIYKKTPFDTMDQVVDFLANQGHYNQFGVDVRAEWDHMNRAISKSTHSGVRAAAEYVNQYESMNSINDVIGARADELLAIRADNLSTAMKAGSKPSQLVDSVNSIVSKTTKSSLTKGYMAGALAVTAAGFTWSMITGGGNKAEDRYSRSPSIVSYGYEEWAAQQAEFFGNRENVPNQGMGEQGVAGATRKRYTDFGSPYQGIQASQQVFIDQELLNEREKYLRMKYGAEHYEDTGVFGAFGPLGKAFGRQGYSYIQGGQAVTPGKYSSLKGNLVSINMDQGWKMEVEDADTVVVKRGGVRGAVASFFGMNKGYSFRLAGVDSTETSHGQQSYHAPQPHAEAAAEALKSLIKGSGNVELVYDPSQTTYGRMMGAVIADGKNVNFEVIRRGLAAHLPFGKREDSMINYDQMGKIERAAFQSKRGLWSQPWAQAFYDFSAASGNRMTFNTLTRKERIVQNNIVMTQLSLMEHAQASGMYNAYHAMEAKQLGRNYEIGADDVSPTFFSRPSSYSKSILQEQLRDQSSFMATKGTGYAPHKHSHRGGYGQLNRSMALDSMGSSNNIWSRRQLQSYDNYETRKYIDRNRKASMSRMQRQANHQFGNNGINHYAM